MKTQMVYKCLDCEEITEYEDSLETLYECNNCGIRFIRSNSYTGANHQCPDCMKFASKVDIKGCPGCGEGECEEIEMAWNEETWEWVVPED